MLGKIGEKVDPMADPKSTEGKKIKIIEQSIKGQSVNTGWFLLRAMRLSANLDPKYTG